MQTTLVLMAAGMGSRYGGLKQLDTFGPQGETLMDYGVFDALRAGFTRVIFVIRKDFEAEFRERVAAKYAGRIRVELAFQALDALPPGFSVPVGRSKPWGTTQALLAAAPLLDGPFCICNADDFYGRDAYASMAAFLKDAKAGEGALVGFDLGATLSQHGSVARGICKLDGARLVSVEERLKLRADAAGRVLDEVDQARFDLRSPVSMNFWGFHPSANAVFSDFFAAFLGSLKDPLKDECYLPMAVDQGMQAGRLQIQVLGGGTRWFGVTYPDDKPAVQAALKELAASGVYPSQLF